MTLRQILLHKYIYRILAIELASAGEVVCYLGRAHAVAAVLSCRCLHRTQSLEWDGLQCTGGLVNAECVHLAHFAEGAKGMPRGWLDMLADQLWWPLAGALPSQ